MKASEIISLARTQTFTSAANLSDTTGLLYLNLKYKKLVDRINQNVGEEHFADFFSGNLVAGQMEYTLPQKTTTQYGLSNIVAVSVNYKQNNQDNWVRARPVKLGALQKDISRYAQNQPTTDPLYMAFDSGVFILPAPTASVSSGLKLYGTISVVDLAANDAPVIDEKWHDVLALGMEEMIYKAQGKAADAAKAAADYDKAVFDILNAHQNRTLEAVERTLPNLQALGGNYGGISSMNPFGINF